MNRVDKAVSTFQNFNCNGGSNQERGERLLPGGKKAGFPTCGISVVIVFLIHV
jgi:hypothetical protein